MILRAHRGLLPAEQGTRLIAGRPYHWDRVTTVDFVRAQRVETLHLMPGVDPLEPGTCQNVVTVMGMGTQSCCLDAPHIFRDHRTVDGQEWPNPDRVRIAHPDGSGREVRVTDEVAIAMERKAAQAT